MKKHEVLYKLLEDRLVGIIRSNSFEDAIKLTEACIKGGVKTVEVTFTSPKTHLILQELSEKYAQTDVLIGAGSVLDSETARIALLNGAEFIVTPSLNTETIKLCNRYNKLCIPGVMTLSEIVQALETGVELVKIFPASSMGIGFLKAVKAPLPQVMLMPTGGVSLDNAETWLKSGASVLGVGGSMTSGAKEGNYEKVTATAKEFRKIVNGFKKEA